MAGQGTRLSSTNLQPHSRTLNYSTTPRQHHNTKARTSKVQAKAKEGKERREPREEKEKGRRWNESLAQQVRG